MRGEELALGGLLLPIPVREAIIWPKNIIGGVLLIYPTCITECLLCAIGKDENFTAGSLFY